MEAEEFEEKHIKRHGRRRVRSNTFILFYGVHKG